MLPALGFTSTEGERGELLAAKNGVLKTFLGQLDKKGEKINNDGAFLKHIFYKTHNKFLKSYEMHASFDDVLSFGTYDCVSGTFIYALILDHFNYDYKIHESAFHVNLSVTIGEKEFFFEATDPVNGFITDREAIDELNEKINLENAIENFVLKEVGFKELIGLRFLNQAIKYFNEFDYQKATAAIDEAISYYPSTRIENMALLINLQKNRRQVVAVGMDD